MHLIIGSKSRSSWSLRPWLVLKQFEIPFEETVIALDTPDTRANILTFSPVGKVPVLIDNTVTVWDSLAICEYLAEQFPQKQLWPSLCANRAEARSLAAEMHSGFTALRQHCPMNTKLLEVRALTPAVETEVARFASFVTDLRTRFAGEGAFLMGPFSILDAMYAPVASRCRSYSIPLPPAAQAWVDTILALPAMQAWYADGALES